jgi:hypothetical protein
VGVRLLPSVALAGRWVVRLAVGAEASERSHFEHVWAAMQREVLRGGQ